MQLSGFDAFPKIDDAFLQRTVSGGWASILIAAVLALLSFSETLHYLSTQHQYAFEVDSTIRMGVPVAVDVTVNMPCDYLSMDVYDSSGQAMHVGDTVQRFPATFTTEGTFLHGLPHQRDTSDINVKHVIRDAFDGSSSRRSSQPWEDAKKANQAACRFVGSFEINKVNGNVHITALGHAYWGKHVPHDAINFTHRIDKFTFGTNFPNLDTLSSPLSRSHEISLTHFEMYQYFLAVVPTTYESGGARLYTNQYSVTDQHKVLGALQPDGSHATGIPGIFFRYTFEPIAVRITAQGTESFFRFIVRLCGVVGGVYVCTGIMHSIYAWCANVLQDRRHRTVKI